MRRLSWTAAEKIYQCGAHGHHSLYDSGFWTSHRLPHPVISVGNIAWGGTGKTPLTEWICRLLSSSNHSSISTANDEPLNGHQSLLPIILTRGYGSDEVPMMKAHLSGRALIAPDADRVSASKRALNSISLYMNPSNSVNNGTQFENKSVDIDLQVRRLQKSDQHGMKPVFVLDDGLQHYRLARDLNIVMIDACRPWGQYLASGMQSSDPQDPEEGRLLPVGSLREKPSSAFLRSHAIVLHRVDLVDAGRVAIIKQQIQDIMLRQERSLTIAESRFKITGLWQPSSNVHTPINKAAFTLAFAFSAIGNNHAFLQSLEGANIHVLDHFARLDHHKFTNKELQTIRSRLQSLQSVYGSVDIRLVTTEKDYYRMPKQLIEVFEDSLFVVTGSMEVVHGQEELQQLVLSTASASTV